MPTSGSGPRFEVRFDELAFAEDLEHATAAGREVARKARLELERQGIAAERLFRCDAEGRDGTRLGGCVKTRVPWPDGRWGIVFVGIVDETGRVALRVLALGVRHPDAPWRPSVYQVADRRLNG